LLDLEQRRWARDVDGQRGFVSGLFGHGGHGIDNGKRVELGGHER
jgi:hypothetical protein